MTCAKRRSVDGWTPAPHPATTRPRGVAPIRPASASSMPRLGAADPGGAGGPRSPTRTARRVHQRRARRYQRLPEGKVEMHRTRRRTERVGNRAGRDGTPLAAGARMVVGDTGVAEPTDRVAVELQLVDGLARRRCHAARVAGRRCTRSGARARDGPRARRGGNSRPRCPTCTARLRDGRMPSPARARRRKPTARRGARGAGCVRRPRAPVQAARSAIRVRGTRP